MALGILDSIQEQGKIVPLLQLEHNSPEYLHTLIEALRLAQFQPSAFVTYLLTGLPSLVG
jgi:gamma-glutamyltranspeptidase / glutathione hydrolase